MKAIVLTKVGGPSVLEYVDVATPSPGPGEVLVRAHTIGVSRPELTVRAGTYPWMPPLPAIPGIEMAGTVAGIGENVTGLAEGDHVLVSARDLPHRAGCYAEYIAVPSHAARVLPPGTDLEAAACLSSYQVAYHVIHTAGRLVTAGSVLLDAASGGVGTAAIQLCKLAGRSPIIALVTGQEKARALEEFGVDFAIDRGVEDTAKRVNAITGDRGVDLILNATGGKRLNEQIPLVAPLGLVVSYSRLEAPFAEDLMDLLSVDGVVSMQSAAIRLFNMHTFDDRPEYRDESMSYLIDKLAAGEIKPLIHATLPLRDAWRAHEMLEERQVTGNVVLKPEHSS